jgi:hypothetical protein
MSTAMIISPHTACLTHEPNSTRTNTNTAKRVHTKPATHTQIHQSKTSLVLTSHKTPAFTHTDSTHTAILSYSINPHGKNPTTSSQPLNITTTQSQGPRQTSSTHGFTLNITHTATHTGSHKTRDPYTGSPRSRE